jgi:transcriptional regulator NrdR family protein
MKCPYCNAPTDVKETRMKDDHVYRRRVCFNNHKFATHERPAPADARRIAQMVAFYKARPEAVSEATEARPISTGVRRSTVLKGVKK